MIKIIAFLLLSASSAVFSGELDSLKNIAEQLVRVRQDIEALHQQINDKKERFKEQMRAFSNQKTDLKIKISRAELNNKELQRELDRLLAAKQKSNRSFANITPVVAHSVQRLKKRVEKSLPFKTAERLQALEAIEHRLKTGLVSPNKAANQLWAFVEDEMMLGRSNGLYQDALNIAGKDKLVKVLRLGMVAMFYRSASGAGAEYGVIKRLDGHWQRLPVYDEQSRLQLDKLFDSFNKNIRNGQFRVPDFIPEEGA